MMTNFGLYLITGHPLEHNINIRWPATDPEPEGYCIDCKEHVDVRWVHPGWLDSGILDTDISLKDLGLNGEIQLDEHGEAYAKGMAGSILQAAANFQKATRMKRFQQKRKEPYLRHKGFVKRVIGLKPGSTTGEVYDNYSVWARGEGERPRSSRRVRTLLAELEEEGLVTAREENRGKRGRTKIWEVV